jgi:hypothetical protein
LCTIAEYRHLFGKRMKLLDLYERILGKPLAQTHRANEDAMAVWEILAADKFFDKLKGE